jgi:hypothetical protein
LAKRPVTPAYFIFYILFSPDAWRILIGLFIAVLLAPYIVKPDMTALARAVVFFMVAAIGYAASGRPAGGITKILKHLILGDKQP